MGSGLGLKHPRHACRERHGILRFRAAHESVCITCVHCNYCHIFNVNVSTRVLLTDALGKAAFRHIRAVEKRLKFANICWVT